MFLTPEHLVERLYLKRGAKVGDFGAGAGAYAIALAEAVGDEGKVYAIDLHRDHLQTLENTVRKMGFLSIDTMWANIEDGTHLDAYTLDAVVLSNVLFQIERKDDVLKEVERVLIPGGRVLCVDWSSSHGGLGPHKDHVFPEAQAEELFTRHGFSIGERLPAGDFHYAFIATKL
jgi:ubiquinone/menaquinone biosynthesis C-methylase UbiE